MLKTKEQIVTACDNAKILSVEVVEDYDTGGAGFYIEFYEMDQEPVLVSDIFCCSKLAGEYAKRLIDEEVLVASIFEIIEDFLEDAYSLK